jgi:hypothetical protein
VVEVRDAVLIGHDHASPPGHQFMGHNLAHNVL